MVLAAVALSVSVVGMTVMTARLGTKMTSTDVLEGGEKRVRTSGWQIETKWFFTVSAVVSLSALVFALNSQSRSQRAGGPPM